MFMIKSIYISYVAVQFCQYFTIFFYHSEHAWCPIETSVIFNDVNFWYWNGRKCEQVIFLFVIMEDYSSSSSDDEFYLMASSIYTASKKEIWMAIPSLHGCSFFGIHFDFYFFPVLSLNLIITILYKIILHHIHM